MSIGIFHFAISSNDEYLVSLLLEKGADPNLLDVYSLHDPAIALYQSLIS
jgi:hypothetical protein